MSKRDPFKVKLKSSKKTRPAICDHVYKEPTTKELIAMLARAKEIQSQLDEVKPLYRELDEITFSVIRVKERVEKHGAVLIDQYADKNTQFRNVAMKRFELKWK